MTRYPYNEFVKSDHHHEATWRTDWDAAFAWMGQTYVEANPAMKEDNCGAFGSGDNGIIPKGTVIGASWKQRSGELMDYLFDVHGYPMVSQCKGLLEAV